MPSLTPASCQGRAPPGLFNPLPFYLGTCTPGTGRQAEGPTLDFPTWGRKCRRGYPTAQRAGVQSWQGTTIVH